MAGYQQDLFPLLCSIEDRLKRIEAYVSQRSDVKLAGEEEGDKWPGKEGSTFTAPMPTEMDAGRSMSFRLMARETLGTLRAKPMPENMPKRVRSKSKGKESVSSGVPTNTPKRNET